MRNKLYHVAFALLVCALIGTSASAGTKSYHVTFNEDITVGDTLIKQGDYKVAFDDQSKELQVIRGSKVVARAAATLEEAKSSGKYKPAYRTLKTAGGDLLLLTVDVGGKYAVVNSNKIAQARAASQAGQ